jgi:hypothetical protein
MPVPFIVTPEYIEGEGLDIFSRCLAYPVSVDDGKNAACKHFIGCPSGACLSGNCRKTSRTVNKVLNETPLFKDP